jgi:hypothetical protein
VCVRACARAERAGVHTVCLELCVRAAPARSPCLRPRAYVRARALASAARAHFGPCAHVRTCTCAHVQAHQAWRAPLSVRKPARKVGTAKRIRLAMEPKMDATACSRVACRRARVFNMCQCM